MAVELPWVVWEQLDSQRDMSNWSIHAWNQDTRTSWVVATSRQGDGTYVPGPQPVPVLRHAVVAWAQPIPSGRGYVQAELRLMDLPSRQQSTVDTGRISSPVYAGPYLAWGRLSDDGAYSLRAVEAATRRAVTLPDRVSRPASIGYLGGSPQYLAWTSQDQRELLVWRVGSTHYDHFTSPDTRHYFQFLQIVGHFVLWYGGTASSVLDLNTGNAFDVHGTVSGSPEWIIMAEPVREPATKTSIVASRLSGIATASAPVVSTCVNPH
jgi:hypothetical protein